MCVLADCAITILDNFVTVINQCICETRLWVWTPNQKLKRFFFLNTGIFYPYSLNACRNCTFTLSANSAWSVRKLFMFFKLFTFHALKNIAHNSLCMFSILNRRLATWPLTSFFYAHEQPGWADEIVLQSKPKLWGRSVMESIASGRISGNMWKVYHSFTTWHPVSLGHTKESQRHHYHSSMVMMMMAIVNLHSIPNIHGKAMLMGLTCGSLIAKSNTHTHSHSHTQACIHIK